MLASIYYSDSHSIQVGKCTTSDSREAGLQAFNSTHDRDGRSEDAITHDEAHTQHYGHQEAALGDLVLNKLLPPILHS